MNKYIFKIWGINLLVNIILFVIYKLTGFSNNYSKDMGFAETVEFLFKVFTNLYLSALLFQILFFSSLLTLLNLIPKIRNNFYLSFLFFLVIPIILLVYIFFVIIKTSGLQFYAIVLVLTITYNLITYYEFLWLRKKTQYITMAKMTVK